MPMINVSEATGLVLNYLVARCERHESRCAWMVAEGWDKWQSYERAWGNPIPGYSTDWAHGGTILDREEITIDYRDNETQARNWAVSDFVIARAGKKQGLLAAMRCYVITKLGDTVEVPDGLQ